MKCYRAYKLSAKEQKAFNDTVTRMSIEWFNNRRFDIDKIVMYTLSKYFGWGEQRLRRFYKVFVKVEDKLLEEYENFIDTDFAADIYLMSKGVNVEKWYEEYGHGE